MFQPGLGSAPRSAGGPGLGVNSTAIKLSDLITFGMFAMEELTQENWSVRSACAFL